eukprot:1814318-Prymnesium_polylepis.1
MVACIFQGRLHVTYFVRVRLHETDMARRAAQRAASRAGRATTARPERVFIPRAERFNDAG